MVSTTCSNYKGPNSFSERAERTQAYNFDIVNFCYKQMMEKTEGLFAVLLVWSVRNGRQGEFKIINNNGGKLYRPSSSYKNLLDRVNFWTVFIAWRVGYKIVAYNATFLGVGRRISIFCVCVAKTVLILLLSLLLCILLWWWCVKIAKWTEPINVNIRFQTLKTTFCLNVLAKKVYHVLR